MEITTAWGSTWRIASNTEILLILAFILLILLLLYLVKYNQILKKNQIHENQMLLFKAKHLGLTNFQYKVLKGISEIVDLKRPYDILKSPDKFEKAIGDFLHYISEFKESKDSILNLSRDIVITYEKIYHHADIRKPLNDFSEIEDNKLIYFCTSDENILIGKMQKDINNKIFIRLFRDRKHSSKLKISEAIEVHLWRSGDAEYSFNTEVLSFENGTIYIKEPSELTRKNAVRTPFVDVILPCSLKFPSGNVLDDEKEISSTIFKLNEKEFIIRTTATLDFKRKYTVNFNLNEFNVIAQCTIISDRTITQENTNYYTFKFENLSKAGSGIINKYITDRM